MKIRTKLQDGFGRLGATLAIPIAVVWACYRWWPVDPNAQKDLLGGMQKVSFVSAAFAVTAYNLRTRVIDLVLKIEGKPARVEEFCRIARNCGGRLTNLVILFTITSIWLGGLSIFREGTTAAKIAAAGSLVLFSASTVSFFYILFAFERLERFVLDEAEQNARVKEASRLFKPESVPESPDKPKTDGK